MGVCNCSIGPGRNGCAACGAPGWGQTYPSVQPQPIINYFPAWWPAPLTEERVREIVREEIAAKDTEPGPEPSPEQADT